MDILIFLEHHKDNVHRMSMEAIAAGQAMAKDLGGSAAAIILGDGTDELAQQVSGTNLEEVMVVNHSLLGGYSADGYAQAVRQVVEAEQPNYVIAGHTYQARDFLPKVSAMLSRPLMADNVSYRMENGSPVFTRQVFQGKMAADSKPTGEAPWIITFQSAAFQEDAVESGTAEIRAVDVTLDESMIRTKSEEPFQEAAGEVDLSAASLIVAIGRGIGKEENLPMVQELADTLGAQIGSSRPVVDAGWLPPDHQIGSSGQTVAPQLYLALGISGAIQHVVGMKGARNVIVINKDPDAPIFELADYGIVGDILEIIPKLTEAIRAAKN